MKNEGPPATPPDEGGLGAELAVAAEEAGVRKAHMRPASLLTLGALAGAFIALGSAFSLVAVTGVGEALPFGLVRLVAGVTFSLGLVLVLTTGVELFTGNVLLVMAWTRGRICTGRLLACWGWVLLGNLLGAVATALLLLASGFHEQAGGHVATVILTAAQTKAALDPLKAFVLGVLCNGLVCLAVWCSFGARSLTDRVFAVLFPVTAFVALGFEHSVANLFLLPYALLLPAADPATVAHASAGLPALTWSGALLNNLIPVTLGNIVGGSLLVATPYSLAYREQRPPTP